MFATAPEFAKAFEPRVLVGTVPQELVEAFETRQSAKALDRLLEQKRPPYRGAGIEVQH